jgi:hypothetical protein
MPFISRAAANLLDALVAERIGSVRRSLSIAPAPAECG